MDGDELYGDGFSTTSSAATPTARSPTCSTCPSSRRCAGAAAGTISAAHGAAIVFDLLVIGGLFLLGRRLRSGREGFALGLALAYAWTAYPYTSFVLETNSNDSLIALACVAALLGSRSRWSQGLRRGALSRWAWAASSQVRHARPGAVVCTPGPDDLRRRACPHPRGGSPAVRAGRRLARVARTVGYQAGRPSPFSIWGQVDSLGWLQTIVKAAAVGLALLVAVVPCRPGLPQTAALGAAVLIAVQSPRRTGSISTSSGSCRSCWWLHGGAQSLPSETEEATDRAPRELVPARRPDEGRGVAPPPNRASR